MNNIRNDVYKIAICFSGHGKEVIERFNRAAKNAGIGGVKPFICMEDDTDADPGDFTHITLGDFTKKGFEEHCALIFVGAVGIAVRAISEYVHDKLTDSPVVVIDDNARFVIPILSGHAKGANKLAVTVAKLLDATPVITTSTDVNSAFSADVFAVENHLTIRNREGIKKVSAKAIEGKPITISVKDYPPTEKVDIILTDETDHEYDLLLSPKKYFIGIGTKKGKDPEDAEKFILKVLADNSVDINDVYAVCTVDIKENEPAINDFCKKYSLPLITFEASILKRVQGDFTSSKFVNDTIGVDNVCERSAALGAGAGAKIICPKTLGDGITVAIAKRG